jgi:hypothetical protein
MGWNTSELTMKTGFGLKLLAAAALISAIGSVHAAPQVFFGADAVVGELPANGFAVAARNSYLEATTGNLLEAFEVARPGTRPTVGSPLSVLGGAGSITPLGNPNLSAVRNTGSAGRFNTTANCIAGTGCSWWETAGSFQISLTDAVSSIGFYGTDFSDFKSTVTIQFQFDDGAPVLQTVTTLGEIVVPSAGNSGGVLFFGYVADTFKFNRINFRLDQSRAIDPNDSSTFDFIGIDDLTVGQRANRQGVPEPLSLGLVGLGLGLVAATRRRNASK